MAAAVGLQQYATDIDGNSVGSYWALSPRPFFSEQPNRVVVNGRFGTGGGFSALVAALLDAQFLVDSAFPLATGSKLYEYDYAICASGSGSLSEVRAAIAPVTGARLVGAYVSHELTG